MECCDKNNSEHKHNQPNSEQEGEYYTCPMHPEIVQDKPGLCPECGMSLVPLKNKDKSESKNDKLSDKHEGHSKNIFKMKFWVSLILSIPVITYSAILKNIFGFEAPYFYGSEYIPLVLSTIIFFYGGLLFVKSAIREIRAKMPGMMTLIALAISTAYIYSVAVTFFITGDPLFWELATLIVIMLLGHWIEMRAVQGTQGALKELSKLIPDTAEVKRGNSMEIIPIKELKVGDILFIRPGGKIPADAKVVQGETDVNESMITGESKPVHKKLGDEVIAGTINGNATIEAEVTKIGEDTFLAGVVRLVEDAQSSKSKLQLLSDKAAFYLTIIAIVTGGFTLIAWLIAGQTGSYALTRLVSVLVITCPHALGVAIPLVASISTTMAARNGFLVRQRISLEQARQIDIVLFDKTGTLTKGEYGVDKIWPVHSEKEEDVLKIAASVDSHSEHYISKAIVNEAKSRGINLKEINDFERIAGRGVQAKIEGSLAMIGAREFLDESDILIPREIVGELEQKNKEGKTLIYVVWGNKLQGVISLSDIIRPESKETISQLKKLGVKVAMITGDTQPVADWVSRELGIDEYFARVLPNEKSDKVKKLQDRGMKVAMVGDGINDAPALTLADLGVAIGAGTNVAIESAGIILVKNDPRDISKIIKLSKMTYSKMIQNLFWATGYNILAIPLAAGVLVSKGVVLQPAVAAVLMSFSTIIVAVNAVLLKRKSLTV